MAKKKVEPIEKKTQVPIEWHIPDTIITRFASHMIVQIIDGNEFKISFFELKPEINLITPKAAPNVVRADCVASVIVTPEKMSKIVEVLQRQLELYNSNKQTNK